MDRFTREHKRKNLQAVKSSGSKIEIKLAKALWNKGYRYRKNNKTVYGKPDFTFKKIKLAIFADGEFWHGYKWNEKKPTIKNNRDFWISKIERNIERDREVNETLKKQGWTVLRFWETEINKNLSNCVRKIEGAIKDLVNN